MHDPTKKPPFDYNWDYHAAPPGPDWIRNLLGEDYFRYVLRVYFRHNAVSESDLAQLRKLPSVKSLYFPGTKLRADDTDESRPIGDTDLVVLRGMTNLQSLLFDDCTEIHGSGLSYISKFKRITDLRLRNSPLEDIGMEHIGELVSLETLELSNCHVTSKGFRNLKSLANLRGLDVSNCGFSDDDLQFVNPERLIVLDLQDTKISDAGMKEIGKMAALKELVLVRTKVTDAGLAHLQDLKQLQRLRLSGTAVSDVGLQSLKELKQLKQVSVAGTAVTKEGAQALKRFLPSTQIIWAVDRRGGPIE